MNDNRRSELEETLSNLLEPPLPQSPKILRFGDFYSGEGETSKLAQELEMEVVYAVEEDAESRATYAENIGLEPQPQIPRLFDDVPLMELAFVCLSDASTDEILRKGSPFQEFARFLRVRRPPGIIIKFPSDYSHDALAEVLNELRSLRYFNSRYEEDDHILIFGSRGRGFHNINTYLWERKSRTDEPLLRILMTHYKENLEQTNIRNYTVSVEPYQTRGKAAG